MRHRLDQLLVARAADLIARAAVRVDGAVAMKAGQLVAESAVLEVDATANAWVARSGAKLKAALETFGLDASGRIGLDIGASTGASRRFCWRRAPQRSMRWMWGMTSCIRACATTRASSAWKARTPARWIAA